MKKYLRIEMSDGIQYDIPAEVIAENRAVYFDQNSDDRMPYHGSCLPPRLHNSEKEYALEHDELLMEWATKNMDWNSLKQYAIKVKDSDADYNEDWKMKNKEIVKY
ncbi:MAG: hypothetical protein AB7G87_05955 [Clostridia bacterium]